MTTMRGFPCICLLLLLLGGCVSFEPRQLAPSITLSAEQIELSDPVGSETTGVDFGLTVGVNESDSLSNIVVLPGIRVRAVAADSPAAAAGLRAGDVILSVDGIATDTADALYAVARRGQAGDQFNFQLRRNTTVLEVVLSGRATGNAAMPMVELYRVDPVASRAGYRTELVAVRGQ
ncbi:MAG: PDZ domain-containing protein, partial [Pseudohongiellaceae bacterium]